MVRLQTPRLQREEAGDDTGIKIKAFLEGAGILFDDAVINLFLMAFK